MHIEHEVRILKYFIGKREAIQLFEQIIWFQVVNDEENYCLYVDLMKGLNSSLSAC